MQQWNVPQEERDTGNTEIIKRLVRGRKEKGEEKFRGKTPAKHSEQKIFIRLVKKLTKKEKGI